MMPPSDIICPDCGIEMDQIEKNHHHRPRHARVTSVLNAKQIVDCGDALWKILDDARSGR